MFVKPNAGLDVPDPERGDLLPESGRSVDRNQYWLRRIKDGDVILSTKPKKPKSKQNEG